MEIFIDGRATVEYCGTGMGTYTHNLIQGLKGEIKSPCKIALSHSEYADINHIETHWEHTKENPKFWQYVHQNPLASDLHCDMLHNPHNGFGIPKNADFPIVTTIHDVIPLIMPEFCGSPYREIFAEEIKNHVLCSQHIIAVSQRTKADIMEYLNVPAKKITVIHQGTESIFKPINCDTSTGFLEAKYGIKNDFLLYVGGFNPRKNLTKLVTAFAKIQNEIPWNLLLLGKEGKRSAEIKKLILSLNLENRIKFLGYIPRIHLPYFYNAAKLFIYPSLYEGFGLPPLEAASCGTAVMVSRTAALPEVMKNCALYIDPDDDSSIAQGILYIYNNEKERLFLAKEGLKRSRQFSPSLAAKKTLTVYENLCR